MSTLSRLPARDLEELSAYIDGQLEPRARARLQARLQHDETLKRAERELRATIELVGSLPQVAPPRRFTLTPEMAGLKPRRLAYPAFRLATAVATLAFLVTVGMDALTRTAALTASRAAPAPAQLQAPAAAGEALPSVATASPPVETFSMLAPTPTPPLQEKTVIGLGGGPSPVEGTPAPTQAEQVLRSAAPPVPGTVVTPSPCAGCAGLATEGAVADQAQRNSLAATPTGPVELPAAAAATSAAPSEAEGPIVIRVVEVSLAALAVLLGGLTIWLRRRTG